MKNKFSTGSTILVIAVTLLSGCAKAPQTEIDAAKAAIEDAKTSGADTYTHDSFVALQDSLNNAIVSVEAQNSKFFKDYSAAKALLENVAKLATEVKAQAETKKEEVKVETQNTIAEAKALVESNKVLISEAPKGKEGASALATISEEINTIETAINEANTMFESGEYMATLDKAKAAKEKASSINAELTEVISKHKTNTKNKKA